MKDYAQIVTKVTSTPWMIEENALKMMLDILNAHLSGSLSHEEIQLRLQSAGRQRSSDGETRRSHAVGILPLHGPIFPKANLMTEMSGATSLEQFRSEFRSLMADDSIGGIMLDIDSPGGLSDMVDEMASEIHAASQVKPVYAVANTAANSAAYYIASQATKMFSTPSGQVGSIGTYTVHEDDTGMQERLGIKRTIIKSDRFKAVGAEPLTPETHSHIQDHVDQANDGFVAAVARGRNVSDDHVRKYFGEGGVVGPKSALDKGMIDGIATSEEVLSMLANDVTGGGVQVAASSGVAVTATGHVVTNTSNMAANPELRQSYDADKEHSEPGTGTGGEPTPREPPETGDKAIEGGWRRDPPPIAYEETEELTVDRAWMEARATTLAIEFNDETTDEELAGLVTSRMDEIVVPINNAAGEAEKARQWEQDYPEQARELARLRQGQDSADAREFAAGYARFDGENKGFSTLVRDQIAQAHLDVSKRMFNHESLKTLLDAVAKKEATVPLDETGSSRAPDQIEGEVVPGGNVKETRQKFFDLVQSAMTEDGMTRKKAIEQVSKAHPALAAAYLGQRQ